MARRNLGEALKTVYAVFEGDVTWSTIEKFPLLDQVLLGFALMLLEGDLIKSGDGYKTKQAQSPTGLFDKLLVAGRKFSSITASSFLGCCKSYNLQQLPARRGDVVFKLPDELIRIKEKYGKNEHIAAFLEKKG